MTRLVCFAFVLTLLAGSPCIYAAESDSKSQSEVGKELQKDVQAKVRDEIEKRVEKKSNELIDKAYNKFYFLSKIEPGADFKMIMKGQKSLSDTMGNLDTLNKALLQLAEGDMTGLAYNVIKELAGKIPGVKYAFAFAEDMNAMLTSVANATKENNLEFIRKEFFKQSLPHCKDESCEEAKRQFAMNMGERLMTDGGEYGLVTWYCKEGGAEASLKCGSICVSGPFEWAKRRSFENSGCEPAAVKSFIEQDQKIRNAISKKFLLLQEIENIKKGQLELKEAKRLIELNLEKFRQAEEKKLAEQEKLKEEKLQAAQEKVAMAKTPEDCDAACFKRRSSARVQYDAVNKEIADRRSAIIVKERDLTSEMSAKNRELKYYSPDEVKSDPGDPAIDEDNVDYNGRQAENLDKLISNAEKWLQVQPMQIRIYDERISGLQGLSGLYGQSLSLYAQYGIVWFNYRSQAETTGNTLSILETEIKGWELQKQILLDEVSLVQTNLSKYKALRDKYQKAFDEGARKAKETLEKEIEPAFKEYEEVSKEYESNENEIRTYEQEKLVQVNVVMAKIRNAKSQSELDAIPPQADKDRAEYGNLRQKQSQLAGKIDEKRQKIDLVSRSKKMSGAKKTLGYKGKSVFSRKAGSDLSGSRFSLSQFLKYIAEANRYVVDACAQNYDRALKMIPSDEIKIIVIPEKELQKLRSELHALTGELMIRSIKERASAVARMKDFNNAYSAYQADLGSHLKYGDWKIDDVLSEEARGALNRLAFFSDKHFRPLLEKRSLKIREKVTYGRPRIGQGAEPVHGAVRLTDADVKDGVVPFQITATGWGIAGAIVKVSAAGQNLSLEIETSMAGDQPRSVYTAMIPVKGGSDVNVSYTIGNWNYSLTLQPPVNTTATQDEIRQIRDFYEKFKQAYESRNDSQIMAMISNAWAAGDGSTLSDLQTTLRRTFRIFDEIRYNIQNLSITAGKDGRYNVSYDVTITSRIYKRNLKHEEKSSINEEVVIDNSGKPKISKTLGGRFWYVQ